MKTKKKLASRKKLKRDYHRKCWAPLKCKTFVWLGAANCYWTAHRLEHMAYNIQMNAFCEARRMRRSPISLQTTSYPGDKVRASRSLITHSLETGAGEMCRLQGCMVRQPAEVLKVGRSKGALPASTAR